MDKLVKIYLDAVHGGADSGALGHGLREKDVTLALCERMARLFDEYVVDVRLSRNRDVTMSLRERTDDANRWGADFLLSVHVNAGGGTGYEDYIYNGSVLPETMRIRDVVHREVALELGDVRNRGKKRANFHMLRESKMAAMLSENLFIDTAADAAKLKSAVYLQKIARGHVNGIVKAFGLKKRTSAGSISAGNAVFYRVVAGSFHERANADAQVARLKKLGVDGVFIDVYRG